MLKKFTLTIAILFSLILTGCQPTEEVKSDSTIVYEVKDSISFTELEIIENIEIPNSEIEGVQLEWTSSKPEYLSVDGTVVRPTFDIGDQEVSLSVVITLNDAVATKSFTFTILSTAVEFDTRSTDALTIDFDYANKSFLNDGVGEVTLDSCVDGDTAFFTEGNQTFSVRFLGVNTPESTAKFEPWGKPASIFTCGKLENATTIVLEYDLATTRTENNGRYLAYVWYDGRMLNLELVEEAYSGAGAGNGMKYSDLFYTSDLRTQKTSKRIWGELDDSFDYSLDGVQITIEELVKNQEEYVGVKVVVRGTVSRTLNGHPYLQADGYGIYLYVGYEDTFKVAEGNKLVIQSLLLTYYPSKELGAAQLTGYYQRNALIISEGNSVEPVSYTIDELSRDSIGSLVQINELTVVSIFNTEDDAFEITAEDSEGNSIVVRRDAGANDNLTPDLFTVGTSFNVVAPLSRYEGEIQLLLITLDDVTFNTNE